MILSSNVTFFAVFISLQTKAEPNTNSIAACRSFSKPIKDKAVCTLPFPTCNQRIDQLLEVYFSLFLLLHTSVNSPILIFLHYTLVKIKFLLITLYLSKRRIFWIFKLCVINLQDSQLFSPHLDQYIWLIFYLVVWLCISVLVLLSVAVVYLLLLYLRQHCTARRRKKRLNMRWFLWCGLKLIKLVNGSLSNGRISLSIVDIQYGRCWYV